MPLKKNTGYSTSNNKIRIFVYGTLKFKEGLGKKIKTKAKIKGDMYDLGPFPAAVNVGNSTNEIEGQVIEVYDWQINAIDIYEGVPNGLYERVKTKTIEGLDVETYQFAKKVDTALPVIKVWPSAKGLAHWKAN